MAGVGITLRKLMQEETLLGTARACGLAGVLSCGPWVLSIIAVLLIGLIGSADSPNSVAVDQFQLSVTYLMACSLLLTSPLQVSFCRYAADRLYENRDELIFPNLMGALTLTLCVSGIVGACVLGFLFDVSFAYAAPMLAGFTALSGIWVLMIFATALKEHRQVLLGFLAGYGLTVIAALGLRETGTEGLLAGFGVGQVLLFFWLLALVVRRFPGQRLVAFDFLRRGRMFPALVLCGLLYTVAVWADKIIFWFDPLTGVSVIGPLRSSPIYDPPIFLAYLSIVPGMAILVLRMETEFAECCERFYYLVNAGGTLSEIIDAKERLVEAARGTLLDILKVQGATTLVLLAAGEHLLARLGMSPMSSVLLSVHLVAVAVQVQLLAIFSILFYLDQRGAALRLSLVFAVSNIALSLLTLNLGPALYGYGFAGAVTLTTLVGLSALSRRLDQLEYRVFMYERAFC
jgi:uncharacterized membrane protein